MEQRMVIIKKTGYVILLSVALSAGGCSNREDLSPDYRCAVATPAAPVLSAAVAEPPADGAVNLSHGQAANCYICNRPEQRYMFNATLRGNGVPTPGTSGSKGFIPATMPPEEGNQVRVLWSMGGIPPSEQTEGGSPATADDGLYAVIKRGSLRYDATTGYIRFRTTAARLPAQAGNAVIGLFNKNGG